MTRGQGREFDGFGEARLPELSRDRGNQDLAARVDLGRRGQDDRRPLFRVPAPRVGNGYPDNPALV
jgi:hypothetical protein